MQQLIYQKPAWRWRQALPIGNGHTGVMVYGGKHRETLAFNDCNLWSGYPKNHDNPESLRHLKKVRDLIFKGDYKQAEEITKEKLSGFYSQAYMPLGQLKLSFSGVSGKNYERRLDLSSAIHTVQAKGILREAFASYPDQIAVYHIKSQKPFSISITAKSRLRSQVIIDQGLNLVGNAPDYAAPNYLRTELRPIRYNEGKGMSFCLRTEAVTDGIVCYGKKGITIKHATQATLYMATATGFRGYDQMPSTDITVPLAICKQTILNRKGSYEEIKQRHMADYQDIYGRQSLTFGANTEETTDNLVQSAKKGCVDPALVSLLYNYGKYMIIAGSRTGGQALNLQGIWNKDIRPPWSSNYTANINVQMNYWGVTASNLGACIEPYIRLVREIMERGRQTAKINYGCGGFACNHNVDLWRHTSTVKGSPAYMYAPMCGVWLANELYAHYKNGGLEEYRTEIAEIVTEAARFANDYLVLYQGHYVTCPSASPEASFQMHGGTHCLDYASAFEMGLVKQVFANYLEFGTDSSLTSGVTEKLAHLYPFQSGRTGLLEWHADFEIAEKGHRHFSPLYGFYPGRVIRYHRDTKEAQWVRQLFDYRTAHAKSYIGWSAAWAICLAGRLHDGEQAFHIIQSMLGHAIFQNLFCIHPPFLFQIDGNLGFVAGINELLLYEEDGVIDLLPGLPQAWPDGEVRNMVVNGAEISFSWQAGLVTAVSCTQPICIRNEKLASNIQYTDNINFL